LSDADLFGEKQSWQLKGKIGQLLLVFIQRDELLRVVALIVPRDLSLRVTILLSVSRDN
jgi:hypothetical protein